MYAAIGYERENTTMKLTFTADKLDSPGVNWMVPCRSGDCANYQSHVLVEDSYDRLLPAIPLCKSCWRYRDSNGWHGSKLVARRPRVELVKRIPCSVLPEEKCARRGKFFILLQGTRKHFCLEHVAIHSEWTEVFTLNRKGIPFNASEDVNYFYAQYLKK